MLDFNPNRSKKVEDKTFLIKLILLELGLKPSELENMQTCDGKKINKMST